MERIAVFDPIGRVRATFSIPDWGRGQKYESWLKDEWERDADQCMLSLLSRDEYLTLSWSLGGMSIQECHARKQVVSHFMAEIHGSDITYEEAILIYDP